MIPGSQLHVGPPGSRAPDLDRGNGMALSPDLLRILVCSACKGDLGYDEPAQTLTCPRCRLRYKVVEDIPDMIIEEAEKF